MKTNILKILVVLSLLFFMLPTINIEAKEKPILSVSTVYEKAVKTVDLAVFLQSDEKISSGSFDVIYDSTLLRVNDSSVVVGDVLSSYLLSSKNGSTAGKVSLAFANDTGATMNGTVLTFKGTIAKAGATIDLQFENAHFYGEDGKEIAVTLSNGAIKPFDGEEKTHLEKVDNIRPWTITLSSAYHPASLNAYSVKVLNSVGKEMDVVLTKVSSTQFSVKPKGTYIRGTYTLEINEQLLSAGGSKLKEPVRFMFTVQ